MSEMFSDVLGLKAETSEDKSEVVDGLMQLIIDLRKDAKDNKNYALSDKIPDELGKLSIDIRDSKDGAEWSRK